MKIVALKNKSKRLSDFVLTEWKLATPELHGFPYDEAYWEPKKLTLQAVEGKQIVGILDGLLIAGVLYVIELIVKHDRRGRGVGNLLMKRAHAWARDQDAQEIYLVTGVGWRANGFYKKHGFTHAADLPHHYAKTDFVLLRKFIDS